jgi:hypothetical protein
MRVRQSPATDVLERDGQAAVLVDDIVVRLGELSSVLYALCEQPIDVTDLARALEARFGVPVGRSSLDATKGAVEEMIHHGVLRQSS